MSYRFYSIAGFPRVVGAVDCTHIKINSPGGSNSELFRNRKGYFSLNVQVVCDSNLVIRNIIARWPGSVHDSTIFNDSPLCAQFERGDFGTMVLLGDSGYPCRPYLLTPLLNPLTHAEEAYNQSQIKTRNLIERLFGVLKRRFPCLSS
ncbi:putative nuclease HARBI1 [Papilio machaon]|uniref:putative nuclease HARBI1 n=1 Tax=Papilio machaon TaxID=76193 RepID=UPI001E663B9C|nr:putative nuclease HARBI1 [Papilio machaon]